MHQPAPRRGSSAQDLPPCVDCEHQRPPRRGSSAKDLPRATVPCGLHSALVCQDAGATPVREAMVR